MASRLLSFIRTHRSAQLATWAFGGYLTIAIVEDSFFNIHPVTGPSMSPALSPYFSSRAERDTIIVSKWPRSPDGGPMAPFYETLQRGDVVALWKPHDPESRSVKRIVGLPGDKILRNPIRLEKNARRAKRLGFAEVPREITVPAGHVWVEGDNWRESLDSNDFGTIPINLITGRAVQILWPPSRFGAIPARDNKQGSRSRVIPGKGANEDTWEAFVYG